MDNRDFSPFLIGRAMKKSTYTESQIVAILAEGEAGIPVLDVCRKHDISSPT